MSNVTLSASTFLTELMTVSTDLVWKNQTEANLYEDSLNTIDIDVYMSAQKGILDFTNIITFHYEVLIELGFSHDEALNCRVDKTRIPEPLRSMAVSKENLWILEHYEEKNNYYRRLCGLPDVEDTHFFYNTKYPDIPQDIPIHQLPLSMKYLLENRGYLKELMEKHPEKKYLGFLASKLIEPYAARSAERFAILWMNFSEYKNLVSDFKDTYNGARYLITNVYYTKEMVKYNDAYDGFMAMCILFMTIQIMHSKYLDVDISRNFYDLESLRYVYDSYGVPFYSSIPLEYHKKIVRRINMLLSYKGSTQVFFDLFNLFDYGSMDVYEYYIMKTHRFHPDGSPVFAYKEDGTLDKEAMYDIQFGKVRLYDDPPMELSNPINHVDRTTMTTSDPYWIWDKDLWDRLYDEDFNYLETKYIGIQTLFDLMQIVYESSYYFKMLTDHRSSLDTVSLFFNPTGKYINIFTLVIYASALICRKYGYEGMISSQLPHVSKVLGFNFKLDLTKVIRDIKADPHLKADSELVSLLSNLNIHDLKSINSTFARIISLRSLFVNRMYQTKDRETYQAYRALEQTLMYSDVVADAYRKQDGTIAESFTDLLLDLNSDLGVRIQQVELQVEEEINIVLVLLKSSCTSLHYLELADGVDISSVIEYLFKILDFFKSAKSELTGYNIVYAISMRGLNMMKFLSELSKYEESVTFEDQLYHLVDMLSVFTELCHEEDRLMLIRDGLNTRTEQIVMNDQLKHLQDSLHLIQEVLKRHMGDLAFTDVLRVFYTSNLLKDYLLMYERVSLIEEEIDYMTISASIQDELSYLTDRVMHCLEIEVPKRDRLMLEENINHILEHMITVLGSSATDSILAIDYARLLFSKISLKDYIQALFDRDMLFQGTVLDRFRDTQLFRSLVVRMVERILYKSNAVLHDDHPLGIQEKIRVDSALDQLVDTCSQLQEWIQASRDLLPVQDLLERYSFLEKEESAVTQDDVMQNIILFFSIIDMMRMGEKLFSITDTTASISTTTSFESIVKQFQFRIQSGETWGWLDPDSTPMQSTIHHLVESKVGSFRNLLSSLTDTAKLESVRHELDDLFLSIQDQMIVFTQRLDLPVSIETFSDVGTALLLSTYLDPGSFRVEDRLFYKEALQQVMSFMQLATDHLTQTLSNTMLSPEEFSLGEAISFQEWLAGLADRESLDDVITMKLLFESIHDALEMSDRWFDLSDVVTMLQISDDFTSTLDRLVADLNQYRESQMFQSSYVKWVDRLIGLAREANPFRVDLTLTRDQLTDLRREWKEMEDAHYIDDLDRYFTSSGVTESLLLAETWGNLSLAWMKEEHLPYLDEMQQRVLHQRVEHYLQLSDLFTTWVQTVQLDTEALVISDRMHYIYKDHFWDPTLSWEDVLGKSMFAMVLHDTLHTADKLLELNDVVSFTKIADDFDSKIEHLLDMLQPLSEHMDVSPSFLSWAERLLTSIQTTNPFRGEFDLTKDRLEQLTAIWSRWDSLLTMDVLSVSFESKGFLDTRSFSDGWGALQEAWSTQDTMFHGDTIEQGKILQHLRSYGTLTDSLTNWIRSIQLDTDLLPFVDQLPKQSHSLDLPNDTMHWDDVLFQGLWTQVIQDTLDLADQCFDLSDEIPAVKLEEFFQSSLALRWSAIHVVSLKENWNEDHLRYLDSVKGTLRNQDPFRGEMPFTKERVKLLKRKWHVDDVQSYWDMLLSQDQSQSTKSSFGFVDLWMELWERHRGEEILTFQDSLSEGAVNKIFEELFALTDSFRKTREETYGTPSILSLTDSLPKGKQSEKKTEDLSIQDISALCYFAQNLYDSFLFTDRATFLPADILAIQADTGIWKTAFSKLKMIPKFHSHRGWILDRAFGFGVKEWHLLAETILTPKESTFAVSDVWKGLVLERTQESSFFSYLETLSQVGGRETLSGGSLGLQDALPYQRPPLQKDKETNWLLFDASHQWTHGDAVREGKALLTDGAMQLALRELLKDPQRLMDRLLPLLHQSTLETSWPQWKDAHHLLLLQEKSKTTWEMETSLRQKKETITKRDSSEVLSMKTNLTGKEEAHVHSHSHWKSVERLLHQWIQLADLPETGWFLTEQLFRVELTHTKPLGSSLLASEKVRHSYRFHEQSPLRFFSELQGKLGGNFQTAIDLFRESFTVTFSGLQMVSYRELSDWFKTITENYLLSETSELSEQILPVEARSFLDHLYETNRMDRVQHELIHSLLLQDFSLMDQIHPSHWRAWEQSLALVLDRLNLDRNQSRFSIISGVDDILHRHFLKERQNQQFLLEDRLLILREIISPPEG